MSSSTICKRRTKSKKELNVVPVFKRKVSVSYLLQDAAACLHGLMIDTKERNNWSQADIAYRIGMDEGQISKLLAGKQSNMTLETVALLAIAMDHEINVTANPICSDEELDQSEVEMKLIQSFWEEEDCEDEFIDQDVSYLSLERSLSHA